MTLKLIEPLRYLFKDEVRRVGRNWGAGGNGLAPAVSPDRVWLSALS